jgi:hypothetical protein
MAYLLGGIGILVPDRMVIAGHESLVVPWSVHVHGVV